MTLPDVQRLSNHWRRHPPLRTLVAACAKSLGVELPEDKAQEKKNYLSAADFAAMVRATDGGKIGHG